MAVYIDDWRQAATVGRITDRWSHLTADSTEELHRFAQLLGIPRRAFQGHATDRRRDHYDVPEGLRRTAIEHGAIAVTWREAAKMRRIARQKEQTRSVGQKPSGAEGENRSTGEDCVDFDVAEPR